MSTRDGLRDVLNKWEAEIKTLLAQGNRAQAEQIQAVLVSIETALAAEAPEQAVCKNCGRPLSKHRGDGRCPVLPTGA